jgi:hypothetical protein
MTQGSHGRRNRVPVKVEMVGCSPAALKGNATRKRRGPPKRSQREDSLVVNSAPAPGVAGPDGTSTGNKNTSI